MIAVLKPDATIEQRNHLIDWIKGQNVDVHISEGREYTVLGLVGDTSRIDVELMESLSIVDSVKRVTEPFKKSNRSFHPDNTVITVPAGKGGDADKSVSIGDGSCTLIAGPCCIESEEQIESVAAAVKAAGASVLRGGACRAGSSPYEFQGLGADAIGMLVKAGKAVGLPTMSEIINVSDIDLFADIDIIQVGAVNMQNYQLLKELGNINKPVLLKRGAGHTLKELLISAEYIMAGGNENVILCERGIRSFERATKFTLDLSAVPMLHEMSHLPVIVDPSRGVGLARMVQPMALAAAACGADGIMIEVHDDPVHALADGAQSVTPDEFKAIAGKVKAIREGLS